VVAFGEVIHSMIVIPWRPRACAGEPGNPAVVNYLLDSGFARKTRAPE
jgi:hypothetical protein